MIFNPDEQSDLKELVARVDASADLFVLKILTSRGSESESVLRLGVRIMVRPVITYYQDATRRLHCTMRGVSRRKVTSAGVTSRQ
jgi:hypothetical protein